MRVPSGVSQRLDRFARPLLWGESLDSRRPAKARSQDGTDGILATKTDLISECSWSGASRAEQGCQLQHFLMLNEIIDL